jgi:hypothetical protein
LPVEISRARACENKKPDDGPKRRFRFAGGRVSDAPSTPMRIRGASETRPPKKQDDPPAVEMTPNLFSPLSTPTSGR